MAERETMGSFYRRGNPLQSTDKPSGAIKDQAWSDWKQRHAQRQIKKSASKMKMLEAEAQKRRTEMQANDFSEEEESEEELPEEEMPEEEPDYTEGFNDDLEESPAPEEDINIGEEEETPKKKKKGGKKIDRK